MLKLIDSTAEKRKAQTQLMRSLRRVTVSQGKYKIGFRIEAGETSPTLPVYSNGKGDVWFASQRLTDTRVPRYWNAFGIFDPERKAQLITVELNIPLEDNSQRVAGFFARDSETGFIYLMHSGKVGGGKTGVGKQAFLTASPQVLESLIDRDGNERFGIVVSRLDDPTLTARIFTFVREVAEFKRKVTEGVLDAPKFKQKIAEADADDDEFDRFDAEASGRRRGRRKKAIDYISIHGDIVNALHKWREEKAKPGERVSNTGLIDLRVREGVRTTEVYEAKTRTGRQAIYTAVGQLIVHSGGAAGTRKILVLPAEDELPRGVAPVLIAIGIEVLRFTLNGDGLCDFLSG